MFGFNEGLEFGGEWGEGVEPILFEVSECCVGGGCFCDLQQLE